MYLDLYQAYRPKTDGDKENISDDIMFEIKLIRQVEINIDYAEEKLKPAEAQRFVANTFRDGALKTTGTDIDQILPPVSRFGGGNRTEKKKTIIQRLAQFFEKYFGI